MPFSFDQLARACDIYGKFSLIIFAELNEFEFRRSSKMSVHQLHEHIDRYVSELPPEILSDFTQMQERFQYTSDEVGGARLSLLKALHSEAHWKTLYYANKGNETTL